MFKIEPQNHVSNDYLYYSSKLLNIEDLYKFEIAKFMYLYEHNKLPPLFSDYFLPLKKTHCHNTRSSSSNKYFLPFFFSTNKAQTIINYTGVKIWNKIPDSLKKLSYKKFILEYTRRLEANYG